jgi:cyclic dehypoxanthinyl futalosine synthase
MGISTQQAFDCFRSDDLIGIGMEADAIRRQMHPEGVVSYRCLQEVDVASTLLPLSGAFAGSSAALRLNCSTADSLNRVGDLCVELRRHRPGDWIEVGLQSRTVDPDTAKRLPDWRSRGVNSVFVDPREENADYAAVTEAALSIHRAAHAIGMRTALGVPFGCGESLQDRLNYLGAARRVQEESGGFAAFVMLGLDAPGGRELDGATAVERLKMLSVTRMFLDNIDHAQSGQAGAGLKVLQTGLRFGANDAELRLAQTGVTEQDLRRVIRDAGFRPVERDGSYSTLFLN